MLFLKHQNMIKCVYKTSSFRFASRFAISNIPNRPLSVEEWDEFRQDLLSSTENDLTKTNIDVNIVKHCFPSKLDVGKSYIKYLTQSGVEPNTATLATFLKLYYMASKSGTQITNNDLQEITDMLVKSFTLN